MGVLQNADLMQFERVGFYDVPQISAVTEIPEVKKYIGFSVANLVRQNHSTMGIHFFEPDYKFERVWNFPDRYANMLSKFGYIVGPDFSQYFDFPLALQIYNHYRNNWLVAYWQKCYNITVVPTVMWGDYNTFSWCFDGFPKHSILAVSTVGFNGNDELWDMFMEGYYAMMDALEPTQILVYSRSKIDLPGNTAHIPYTFMKGEQVWAEDRIIPEAQEQAY